MNFFAQNLSLSGERDVLFSSLGNKKPKYQSLRPQIASVSPLVNIMRKKKKALHTVSFHAHFLKV